MTFRDFGTSLPQGFRFYPTDEKLVCHYLHKKVVNQLVDLRSTLVEIDLHYVAQQSKNYANPGLWLGQRRLAGRGLTYQPEKPLSSSKIVPAASDQQPANISNNKKKTKESLTPLLKALPNAGSYKLHRRSSSHVCGGSRPLLSMEADAEPSTLINQGSDHVHYQGKIAGHFPTGPIPEHWNLAEQFSC
ncbi:hypothetical protein U1Q18_019352 [Sarracenia purpurea var. burkii]